MKEIVVAVPDGKRAEWVNGVLTLVDDVVEATKDERPVMERIKTFEDACDEVGRLAERGNEGLATLLADYESNAGNIKTKGTLAYMKLCIIAAALNEGWEPQFTTDEYRWYPWFTLWTKEELAEKTEEWRQDSCGPGAVARTTARLCGLACAYSFNAWSNSYASLSARLAVKSEELAGYFGKQFIEIWADYVGPFNLKEESDD